MEASPSNTESSRETVGDELSDADSTTHLFWTKRRQKRLTVGPVLVFFAVMLVMGGFLTSERKSNRNESDGSRNGVRGMSLSLSPSNEPTMSRSGTPSPSEEQLSSPTKQPTLKASLQPTPNPTEKRYRSNSPSQKQSSPPVR